MKRFQFSLRDLFLAMTLIAVGIGGLVWCMRVYGPRRGDASLPFAMAFAFIAIIGAGIGAPFQRKTIGAAAAVLAAFGLLFYIGHNQ